MRVALRVAIATLLLLTALAPTPVTAQDGFSSTGGTKVTVVGSVVTITVTIDLALGSLGETTVPEGAQGEADGVAREIADYWNQGFQRLSSDCLRFELVVKINVVPQADARILILGENSTTWVTTPGHHVVFWGVNNYGNAAPPETYDPYDDDGVALPGEDYGAPLEHELWAMWSPHLENARDFAHEFGHLLGFGDDYDGNDALPGREGTLMDHGDMIDQNLVSRLAGLARDSGAELPECEVWEGTFTYDIRHPSITCSVRYSVAFGVREGEVSGNITLVTNSCPGASSGSRITGTKTGNTFSFATPSFGAGVFKVPITGGNRATRTFSSIPEEIRVLDVRCVSCE